MTEADICHVFLFSFLEDLGNNTANRSFTVSLIMEATVFPFLTERAEDANCGLQVGGLSSTDFSVGKRKLREASEIRHLTTS